MDERTDGRRIFTDAYKRVDRRTDRPTYFHIGKHIDGQTDGRTDTQTDIRPTSGQIFKHIGLNAKAWSIG